MAKKPTPRPGPLSPPGAVPQEDLDVIYGGPLEDFTAARNELAKRLRADGEREAADWVKACKKPSRAAWLVNQLAAREPDQVSELLGVGEELRGLQEQLLLGSVDRDALREAAAREQTAIDGLLRAAGAIGSEQGVGGAILDRVGETLQAASADPEVAEAIRAGRLTREQRASGLGTVGPGATASGGARGPLSSGKGMSRSAKGKSRAGADEAAERRARERAARRRKEAERNVASAEKRLQRERAAVERAREELADREDRRLRAQRDLDAARRTAKELE